MLNNLHLLRLHGMLPSSGGCGGSLWGHGEGLLVSLLGVMWLLWVTVVLLRVVLGQDDLGTTEVHIRRWGHARGLLTRELVDNLQRKSRNFFQIKCKWVIWMLYLE